MDLAAAAAPLAASLLGGFLAEEIESAELVHECAEGVGKIESEAARAGEPAGAGARRHRLMAETVIGRPLLRVFQDLVGFVDLLESLLGPRVPRIPVGVILQRELPVRLLDRVQIGVPFDPKDFVIVSLRHIQPLDCRRNKWIGGAYRGAGAGVKPHRGAGAIARPRCRITAAGVSPKPMRRP